MTFSPGPDAPAPLMPGAAPQPAARRAASPTATATSRGRRRTDVVKAPMPDSFVSGPNLPARESERRWPRRRTWPMTALRPVGRSRPEYAVCRGCRSAPGGRRRLLEPGPDRRVEQVRGLDVPPVADPGHDPPVGDGHDRRDALDGPLDRVRLPAAGDHEGGHLDRAQATGQCAAGDLGDDPAVGP